MVILSGEMIPEEQLALNDNITVRTLTEFLLYSSTILHEFFSSHFKNNPKRQVTLVL